MVSRLNTGFDSMLMTKFPQGRNKILWRCRLATHDSTLPRRRYRPRQEIADAGCVRNASIRHASGP